MSARFDARLLGDLRRANGQAWTLPALDGAYRPTLGDLLDVALGGPAVYVCWHCDAEREPPQHRMCLGGAGGRTCQCAEGPHPLRRQPK
jgi:hypothetical protein